ncbi:MAG TPA: hypothetical protein VGG04_05645 [Candidatus Sulfotelmatobacter sp.]|jgi:hypothetical protein
MAQGKKSGTLATFTYPVKVEVRKPDFEVSDSIRHLDLNALAKAARAEIEIGRVKGCCGGQTVRAVIRKGMVTGIGVDPPSKKDKTPVSPELARLAKAAHEKVLRREKAPKFPIRVPEFFGNKAVYQPVIEVLICVHICFLGYCITCCYPTDIPDHKLDCGHITIDSRVPS